MLSCRQPTVRRLQDDKLTGAADVGMPEHSSLPHTSAANLSTLGEHLTLSVVAFPSLSDAFGCRLLSTFASWYCLTLTYMHLTCCRQFCIPGCSASGQTPHTHHIPSCKLHSAVCPLSQRFHPHIAALHLLPCHHCSAWASAKLQHTSSSTAARPIAQLVCYCIPSQC